MKPHIGRTTGWLLGGILLTGLVIAHPNLWSSSVSQGRIVASQTASAGQMGSSTEAEPLQTAFMRIAQQMGPAVVSISTEQIERVRQYFRVHPFSGGEQQPFEEFFRQFYGDMPQPSLRRFGLGSGVIIDERGLILTNEHVVADADKITVTLADGRDFEGTVKGKDPRSDLAVIQIDAKKLTAATLGNSDALKAGQWAVAIGYPFGAIEKRGALPRPLLGPEPTITVGIVSAVHRVIPGFSRGERGYGDLVQTDADINRGNSGGPLVNLAGEVIGINVAVVTDPGTFGKAGFAIPINKAKRILDALIEGRKIVYGWLGIQIQDIDEEIAEYYGIKDREGVLVYQVLPDSPASKAGLRDGDIIKSYHGQPVHYSRELVDQVTGAKAGQRVSLDILREGKRQTVPVEIGERPTDGELDGTSASSEVWRGVHVAALTPETLDRLNVPPGTTGVVVSEVEPNSPADRAGLHPGDVISEINRTRIETLADYHRLIAQVKGNALVKTNRGYVVIKSEG